MKSADRRITANMTRRGSKDEKDFDRKFWRDAGHEVRFSAAWDMVKESFLFRGEAIGRKSGLQRSVERLQRRKR